MVACLSCVLGRPSAAELAENEDEARPKTGQIKNTGTRAAAAEIAPASDEGLQAMKRMQIPAGLELSLWAAEPMLANPVAFNFDEQGRILVAETYRYRTSVLDIRDYMWMLEDELANRTTADWNATLLRRFGPQGIQELSIESERIRLLEDTDHDGKADRSTLFAEGFSGPLDGIASGVLARRGKVWFTNIPSLWMLESETPGTPAVKRTELSRGYGVRFNFTGHDMHGLTFGPDGKIYYSIGDRGASVITKEGKTIAVPDTGSVFRANPDGTELELFATGLRNPQSLLFTENGDLFTGDNDCDLGDEERLVHVVEGGDSGWRIGYQFSPRAPHSPWLDENLWQQRHASTPAYVLSPICNIEDGPSGIAYYPGTGLNANYAGAIFITHFKGSIVRSGIYTYKVKPSGATYQIADAKPFLTSALPTDVKFGPDGRLYLSDWADGWPKSKRGRIYAIRDPQATDQALVTETQKLIGGDWSKRANAELTRLLGHADWRVRLEAQFTLAERGAASVAVLAGVLNAADAAPLARRHATWGLGQLAAKNPRALEFMGQLLLDADDEVRAQAAKLLGDHRASGSSRSLVTALNDRSPRVRYFAAQSLGKLGQASAAEPLLTFLRKNNDEDEYLRHAAVQGLIGTGNWAVLAEGANSSFRAERLAVLLTYRRMGRSEIAGFLQDADPYLVREAALAINDVPILAAQPALAKMLTSASTDEAVILRAINAHFRLGQPANAAALANYAANPDAPAQLRSEAIAQLALWPKPPARDRLVGIFRPLPDATRDASIARQALAAITPALLDATTPAAVQAATFSALETLETGTVGETLLSVLRDPKQSGASRAAALKALDRMKSPRLAEAVQIAGDSPISELRLAALPVAARLSPDVAAPVLANLVAQGNVMEQKAAFQALGTLKHASAETLLGAQLRKLATGEVDPAVQLELRDAAIRRRSPALQALLDASDAALIANQDPLAAYRFALQGGDKKRGQQIFNNQPVLACVRCHRVGAESGGEAGPNLAGLGSTRSREELLEAIVKPNAKIAPGFDSVVVTLNSGETRAGVVVSETVDRLKLRDPANKIWDVEKARITQRDGAPSSMPEIYATLLKKSELRDVLEYLASLSASPDKPKEDLRPRALRGPPKPKVTTE